jgi:hypothetical protein
MKGLFNEKVKETVLAFPEFVEDIVLCINLFLFIKIQ